MSKEKYAPPALPEDVLPDLDTRMGEVRARWEQAKSIGYAAYQQARAQERAALDSLKEGRKTDHGNLMNGYITQTPRGQQAVAGVKQLDAQAQIKWAEARAYREELDRLEAEAQKQKEAASDGSQPDPDA